MAHIHCTGPGMISGSGQGTGQMSMQPIGPNPVPSLYPCPCIVCTVRSVICKPIFSGSSPSPVPISGPGNEP